MGDKQKYLDNIVYIHSGINVQWLSDFRFVSLSFVYYTFFATDFQMSSFRCLYLEYHMVVDVFPGLVLDVIPQTFFPGPVWKNTVYNSKY